MRFMFLIAGDEKRTFDMKKEEGDQIVAAYIKYTEDLKNAGILLAGDPLNPSAGGSRVSAFGGKRTVTDGPFIESKEIIGGYYMVEVKSKEEAIEWAARCPAAHTAHSYVEVREVMAIPG